MELKAKLEKSREQNTQDVKKLDGRIDRTTTEINGIRLKINQLVNENPWVRSEQAMFGNPESAEYSGLLTLDVP